jgi:hypothetical protein
MTNTPAKQTQLAPTGKSMTSTGAPKKPEGDEGVIIFRGYRKTQQPVKISPLQDSSGKTYTGQGTTGFYEDMTEEERKKLAYVVTPRTVIVIREGKSLDTTNSAKDRADWKWVKKHPYIAATREDGHSSRDAVYYVYNEVREAESSLTRSENIDKAIYKLRFECSEAKRVQLASSLGFPEAKSANPSLLMNWLRDEASIGINALTILKLIEGGAEAQAFQKAMTMFHLLKRYRVIQTYRAGIWRWSGENGMVLGSTQEKVIEFLASPDNAETVVALQEELVKAKALTGEDLAEIDESRVIEVK